MDIECAICHCVTCGADTQMIDGEMYCDACAELSGGGYIETYTGQIVSLKDPDPATIRIEDIAHSLSRTVRWNAHCHPAYTVGDHSIACMECAFRAGYPGIVQLAALLHDAAEAYTGDIVSPLKSLLGSDIKRIEAGLMASVWKSLCRGLPEEYRNPVIKEIDRLMLSTEGFRLMPSKGASLGVNVPPPCESIEIIPGEPNLVAATFEASHKALYRKISIRPLEVGIQE